MSSMSKLTKRFVESIHPDLTTTLKFWDTELKGFGLIVLPVTIQQLPLFNSILAPSTLHDKN